MNETLTLEKKAISHFFSDVVWNELPEYEGYVPVYNQSWEDVEKEFEQKGFSKEKPQVLILEQTLKCIRVMIYGFEEVKEPMDSLKKVVFCKVVMTNKLVAIAYK